MSGITLLLILSFVILPWRVFNASTKFFQKKKKNKRIYLICIYLLIIYELLFTFLHDLVTNLDRQGCASDFLYLEVLVICNTYILCNQIIRKFLHISNIRINICQLNNPKVLTCFQYSYKYMLTKRHLNLMIIS